MKVLIIILLGAILTSCGEPVIHESYDGVIVAMGCTDSQCTIIVRSKGLNKETSTSTKDLEIGDSVRVIYQYSYYSKVIIYE